MLAWRVGDTVYRPERAVRLKQRLDGLIGSMRWKPGTKPYVELHGRVSGKNGLAIRNFGAMDTYVFRNFHRAVERIFFDTMID